MKPKKAIITGPTGAVGVSLIYELLSHNYSVTAVCRPHSKRLGAIPDDPHVDIAECSVSDLSSLSDVLPHDYDVFYHFAWDGTYGDVRQESYRQAKNILYTIDAVHLAAALGCRVFIGAGSQSEFGHIEGALRPDLPCNPDNGYGIAKLAAGMASRIECRKFNIRHEWCRILSMYGPYDGDYTMVMSAIYKLLNGQKPKFTKGEQIWDYIYNKDAARAFRLLAEKGRDGAVYCLGTGQTRRLKDFMYAIRDAIDPNLEIGIGELDYRPNQVMHLQADISALTEDTGFLPEYTFEEGIRETIEWARHRGEHQ